MKGIIFNLAQEVITGSYGEDTWDELLDRAGLDGSYTSLGSYPDDDLVALVGAASAALGRPAGDVVRYIGVGSMPLLAARYPGFFAGHSSTRPFILTLNDIIHAEVRKLYPDADLPTFEFDALDDGSLVLTYRSKRHLCALAEGFIMGAATHYGEHADIDQPRCMLEGHDRCLIRCSFSPANVTPT